MEQMLKKPEILSSQNECHQHYQDRMIGGGETTTGKDKTSSKIDILRVCTYIYNIHTISNNLFSNSPETNKSPSLLNSIALTHPK